jgi:hypothetical protein
MTVHWRVVDDVFRTRAARAVYERGTTAGWWLLLAGVTLALLTSR